MAATIFLRIRMEKVAALRLVPKHDQERLSASALGKATGSCEHPVPWFRLSGFSDVQQNMFDVWPLLSAAIETCDGRSWDNLAHEASTRLAMFALLVERTLEVVTNLLCDS